MTDFDDTPISEMDEKLAAYECRLATCEHLTSDDKCACHSVLGTSDFCPFFRPRHQVRVARRDDGSIYVSRTEQREYLDTTLAWFNRQSAAEEFARTVAPFLSQSTAPATAG